MKVYAFVCLGVFLAVAPWSAIYEYAVPLSTAPTRAGAWLRTGWVRGLITGVGLLDLYVALRAGIALYRDRSAAG